MKQKPFKKTPVAKTKSLTRKQTAPVYNLDGKQVAEFELSRDIFAKATHNKLLAQAVRVYQTNLHRGTAFTKTRGEVTGSTRKIYRQKGTGRARHGDIRAPIFVGGGTVFGPRKKQPKRLLLSKKMRQTVLRASLTQKASDKGIWVIADLSKMSGKTKDMARLLQKIALLGKKILLVVDETFPEAVRAARNIERVTLNTSFSISAYDVLMHQHLVFAKETLEKFQNQLPKNKINKNEN